MSGNAAFVPGAGDDGSALVKVIVQLIRSLLEGIALAATLRIWMKTSRV